jgi:ribosomal protein S12 methylthiotransferase
MLIGKNDEGSDSVDIRTTKDFQQDRIRQGQNVGIINLGCARNLVDSQEILGRLKKKGHRIVDTRDAEIVVVNTCSFIAEAKQESIDTILDLVELKKQGRIKKVVVAGCLAQRYGRELAQEIKGIDAIIGVPTIAREGVVDQVQLTPAHFAYVKICESCYNQCRFCAIPKIKGKFRSRSIESVVEEIRRLDANGVKEINIIGQDITAYGMDIYREKRLAVLLKEIVKVTKQISWIRLLYAFPAHVTDELIEVIAQEEKICKYIDIPLQHISDPILKSMNRSITTQQTKELIHKIRTRIPDARLRTTFIVGLPGETEENFRELLDFVKTEQFDKVGVFVYSHEEGTEAYTMSGQVAGTVKKKRLNTLMKVQREISRSLQSRFVDRTLKVLIDDTQDAGSYQYLGRTEYDAHDVDGTVFVHASGPLKAGDFVKVKVTDALEYDLVGHAL